MCELRVLCKKYYGMICKRNENTLRCLKVRGDNGRLVDFYLKKDDLEMIWKINRY